MIQNYIWLQEMYLQFCLFKDLISILPSLAHDILVQIYSNIWTKKNYIPFNLIFTSVDGVERIASTKLEPAFGHLNGTTCMSIRSGMDTD